MSKKGKLTIELVPSSSWYSNLRSELSNSDWDKIRKFIYKKNNYKCEICSGRGPKWPVECHEKWDYKNGIQKLTYLYSLCPDCHMVKHIGLAKIKGNYYKALGHFMKVNNCTIAQAKKYIDIVFDKYHARSRQDWELDISYLDNYRHLDLDYFKGKK